MRSSFLTCLVIVLACSVGGAAGTAQAAVRDCPSMPDYKLQPTSVRNMSCASAARVLRRMKVVSATRVSVRGWSCVVTRPPNFRCVQGARAFRSFYLD